MGNIKFISKKGVGLLGLCIVMAGSLVYRDVIITSLTPVPIQVSEQVLLTAANDYQKHCSVCHGVSGEGDGLAAASLAEAPPDLTRTIRFTPGWYVNWIKNGGDVMPVWKDVLSAEQIYGLSHYIDSIAK